jgi:aminopeptidase N
MSPRSLRAAVVAVLVLLGTLTAQPAWSQGKILNPLHDAVSYDADLTTTGNGRTFTGTETIVVRDAGRTPLTRVWLRLWGNGVKGCRPRAVTVVSVTGGRKHRLLEDCTALEILLPEPLRSGRSTTLTLKVSITTPSVQDRFGATEGIQMFGNALPIVAQRDARAWRLPAYSAYGESFVSTWAHFALTLHHPVGLSVAASGTTLTTPDPNGTTATTTSTIDARDTFWAIGAMTAETVTTARGTVVHAWSEPDAGADRQDAAKDAVGALQQLEKHLPAYPYPEYDVVIAHITAGGGMEYPGIVISDGTDDVTRHETGHQWFYGIVGDDQFREPWVDEGITSFLEYTWTTPSELPLPECYPSSRIGLPGPTTFATASMSYWNRHVGRYIVAYDNPVCALRELRTTLGAAKFGRVMRGLVSDHFGGFLTGADVRSAFHRAGGAKTDRVFRKWALAPGL